MDLILASGLFVCFGLKARGKVSGINPPVEIMTLGSFFPLRSWKIQLQQKGIMKSSKSTSYENRSRRSSLFLISSAVVALGLQILNKQPHPEQRQHKVFLGDCPIAPVHKRKGFPKESLMFYGPIVKFQDDQSRGRPGTDAPEGAGSGSLPPGAGPSHDFGLPEPGLGVRKRAGARGSRERGVCVHGPRIREGERVAREPSGVGTPPGGLWGRDHGQGRCMQVSVTYGGRLRKDICTQEFKALRSCFISVAKKTLKGSR
ncbi:hypothetical protein EI555_007439 [Monodon monoceros]|uniref:Uncharacterized protein n=1 Tax=Monodon monoceros TaxID=40151 RepID=A0A4U1EEN7_MONMO|nr:hypothetical protein EI555_007439 [Monodon monoceros]